MRPDKRDSISKETASLRTAGEGVVLAAQSAAKAIDAKRVDAERPQAEAWREDPERWDGMG